jgi:hypothetical protein
MFAINTKFYRATGSSGFRTLLTYYSSGKIKNKKISFNKNEVSDHPFYGDGKPFITAIKMNDNGNYDISVNTYLESPANVYCNLNRYQKFLLKRQFKMTWIQQSENIKWLVMAAFACIGAFLGVVNYLLKCN